MSKKFFSVLDGRMTLRNSLGKYMPSQKTWRIWVDRQELFVLMLLLVVGIFLSLSTDAFLTADNLSNVARYFSWIAIAAIGENIVIGLLGISGRVALLGGWPSLQRPSKGGALLQAEIPHPRVEAFVKQLL